jgi:ABC-type Na+ efflux pump permease subunit
VSAPTRPDFALPSPRVWVVTNVAGAILFLWQSHQLWVSRDEGYTFGDGAPLFYLIVIFGFANIAMLLLNGVIALQTRAWNVLRGPILTLAMWCFVIAFHFMRATLFA